MDADEPFIRQRSWQRFDKIWALGGGLFYGMPFWIGLIAALVGGHPVAALVFGTLFLLVAAFVWYVHSSGAGRLEAEITADAIRFTDSQRPVPWTKVARVEFLHTSSGTYTMSHDYIVLHLTDGTRLRHELDGVLWIEVRLAIQRLAPEKLALDPATGDD